MRLLIGLMMVGCAPAPDHWTPAGFVEPFLDDYCAAAVECERYANVRECMDLIAETWQAGCSSDVRWNASRQNACEQDVQGYACGAEPNEADPWYPHACAGICTPKQ